MEGEIDAVSLQAQDVEFSYEGNRKVLSSLSVTIPKGRITALLGRNGCGKSTLLHVLNRLLMPQQGQVLLEGKPLQDYPARELAKKMAHLAQSPEAPEGLTVRELVDFGRHPYKGFWGRSGPKDKEMVDWALEQTSLQDLANRELNALSGGQRQRAWVAMALAQDTEYLLLDEPTTYLDICHQLETLQLLARLNEEQGKTVVMVVHEPNHASQFAHEVVCLADGDVLLAGSPGEVFTQENIVQLYGVHPLIFEGPEIGRPWCVPHRPRES